MDIQLHTQIEEHEQPLFFKQIITISQVKKYLIKKGWLRIPINKQQTLWFSPSSNEIKIHLVKQSEWNYKIKINEAIKILADFENKPYDQIFNEIIKL